MEQTILSPKSDFIFKLIFGDERNIDILKSFLQAVLDIPPEEYESITIVDPHLKREDGLDKLSILDVKIHTRSGYVIDVEIQLVDVPNMRERIALYTAKMVTEQIAKGDEYGVLKRVISIVITDYALLPEEEPYHNVYRWLNTKTHREFTDLIELNTLELPKLPQQADKSELWDWMRFLKCEKQEEFEMIAAKNPQIEKAVGILMDLSADERTRLLEESHQKALWDYNSRMKGAFDKGEAKGEARGVRQGAKQREFEIARNALRDGFPADAIQRITGLSREEIGRL
ncbi:transposase [Spirochaetia bacterium]|nr:transposase [Spirochaetia bacterium]